MHRRDAIKLAAGIGAAAAIVQPASAEGSETAKGTNSVGIDNVTVGDGTRLFIRDWGAGRPVLFLAGWTLPSDFWAYQMIAAQQAGFRAIAYDRRGHGRSSDPGRGYDHDTLADDLAALIDALELDDVVLIAHSMGGTEIARCFARHGGAKISKVILVGTITPFLMKSDDNPYGIEQAMLAQFRAPLTQDFPAWIEANAAPFFVPETSRDMIEWGKGLMLQTSLLATVELARANGETDFRDDVRQISVPTLIVHGDNDASAPLPLTAQPTAALIPGAELKVYEGAPHGLPLTHVERLNSDILNFLGAE